MNKNHHMVLPQDQVLKAWGAEKPSWGHHKVEGSSLPLGGCTEWSAPEGSDE